MIFFLDIRNYTIAWWELTNLIIIWKVEVKKPYIFTLTFSKTIKFICHSWLWKSHLNLTFETLGVDALKITKTRILIFNIAGWYSYWFDNFTFQGIFKLWLYLGLSVLSLCYGMRGEWPIIRPPQPKFSWVVLDFGLGCGDVAPPPHSCHQQIKQIQFALISSEQIQYATNTCISWQIVFIIRRNRENRTEAYAGCTLYSVQTVLWTDYFYGTQF